MAISFCQTGQQKNNDGFAFSTKIIVKINSYYSSHGIRERRLSFLDFYEGFLKTLSSIHSL